MGHPRRNPLITEAIVFVYRNVFDCLSGLQASGPVSVVPFVKLCDITTRNPIDWSMYIATLKPGSYT